jgi:glycosyltransferase involved in cell wall biosynthesis
LLTISVAINNFNYKRFVAEAIQSALTQTFPPFEIIVVDDGSTDGSADHIRELFGDRVQLIRSENRGQLSALQVGVQTARGDIIAFLDADDRWSPDHLQVASNLLERRADVDFIIGNNVTFGQSEGEVQHDVSADMDLGFSTLAALTGEWVGAPTSCLIARKHVLSFLRHLPPATIDAWRLNADDVIVLGCSVGGARKYRLANPTVFYRVHGGNAFFGLKTSEHKARERRDRAKGLLRQLKRDAFPGLADAQIIRAELPRNSFRRLKHLRKLFKANLQSKGAPGLRISNAAAILKRAFALARSRKQPK